MKKDVLSAKQKKLLPLLKQFSDRFGLVGGTAIALQIKHRRSIDFDLFSRQSLDHDQIKAKIRGGHKIESILIESRQELTMAVNEVKLTFYQYPFKLRYPVGYQGIIKMPDLLTLAAMKAFSLGKRAKWKDYVDLYFVFKKHSLKQVCARARQIYEGEFNERLFREQLIYFEDVDKSEKLDYLPGKQVTDLEIEDGLLPAAVKD